MMSVGFAGIAGLADYHIISMQSGAPILIPCLACGFASLQDFSMTCR